MAFRDIDYDLRVNGDLWVPSSSVKVGSNITINSADGRISATTLAGNGSLITNLSSAAMPDVLLLNGSRAMTGSLTLSSTNELRLKDTGHYIRNQMTGIDGATLDGIRISGYNGVELVRTSGGVELATFRMTGAKINAPLTVTTSITSTTINATGNLQEGGTNLSSKYEAKGTLHDDRYYIKSETDTKLAGKSDTGHAHAWGEITGKPATFAPSTHNHDDRYYTESEVDTKLDTKSNIGHAHAWAEITGKPTTFAPSTHSHDDRYYTETEMDTKLSDKSDTGHTHTFSQITSKPTTLGGYGITDAATSTHHHNSQYEPLGKLHDDRYYLKSEVDTRLAGKSDTSHTHAWAEITSKPNTFAPSAHTHDDRYYTESEIDTKLAGKMNYGDILMNTNPFGGKQLFINSVNNAMFRAESRWIVTGGTRKISDDSVVTNMNESQLAALFDGNYEGSIRINAGEYLLVHIDFNGGNYPGYPYGNLYLSHYHTQHTSAATMRVYCNYEPHGLGWHEYQFEDYLKSGSNFISKTRNPKYNISEMEFKFYGGETEAAWVTQIDWQLDRPGSNEMPIVDKYRPNSLYSRLDFKDIENTVNAFINNNGTAGFKGLTVDGVNVSLHGHTHDDRYYLKSETDTRLAGKSDTSHVHTFASLTSKPTTLSGYGITDASASGHTHTFASITSKPTTLSGYGITDAAISTHNHDTVYSKLDHHHDAAYAAIGHHHNAQYAALSHNHDSVYAKRGTRSESVLAVDKRSWTPAELSTGTKEMQFAFTRLNLDNTGEYVDAIMASTYSDGSGGGVNALMMSKAGNGIHHAYGPWNGTAWSWTKKLAYDEDKADKSVAINTGTGLTGGGNLSTSRTISVSFGTAAGTVAEGNHGHPISGVSGLQAALDEKSNNGHAHTFASLTSKPTTLSGYGITDAATSSHNHDSTYLKLSGGALSGSLIFDNATGVTGKMSTGVVKNIASIGSNNNINIGDTGLSGNLVLMSTSNPKYWNGTSTFDFYHSGNFNPAAKADVSVLSSHTGDSTIHKNWGFWSTNGGQDLLARGKRALVALETGDLIINYGNDFPGVNVQSTLKVNSNEVWHRGNLNTSDFVNTTSAATVAGNFTVAGRAWVGSAGNVGSIVLRNSSNQNTIYLDSGGAGSVSNWRIHLNGADGSARYYGNVRVADLTIDTTRMITNLNAEFIGGSRETEFVRTDSVRDIHGYGVRHGLEVGAKSPTPDMTVQVGPGTAYTDSGRRFNWTANTVVPISQSSQNYDRIDIIFIYGKIAGGNEGTIGVHKGLADRTTPIAPYTALYNENPGAIVLGEIYVRANVGTITDGSAGSFNAINNAPKRLMSVRLSEGVSWSINEPAYIGGDIHEKGMKLENKYAQLATSNTFLGNVKISAPSANLVVESTNGNSSDTRPASLYLKEDAQLDHGMKVEYMGQNNYGSISMVNAGAHTERIRLWRDSNLTEIKTDVNIDGKVKASKNAATLTIPAGQTSVTWTHNYGNASYAVSVISNSFERHIRWTSKTSNSIVIEIDDPSTQETLVDCILIGY